MRGRGDAARAAGDPEHSGVRAAPLARHQTRRANAHHRALVDAERAAFWDLALLELLIASGLRVEEACELPTSLHSRSRMHRR